MAVEPGTLVAIGTLVVVYVLLATERLHRVEAALLGVAIMLTSHFLVGLFAPGFRIWPGEDPFEAVVEHIDLNVLLLLLGMMLVVGEIARTGIFQYLAVHILRTSRGHPWRITVLLSIITAVVSALIDNVTTILLLAPILIEVTKALRLPLVPMLLPQILASNVGGTLTLVGDPPNIIVGSHAGLTFIQFLQHLSWVVAVALGVFLLMVAFQQRRHPVLGKRVPLEDLLPQLEAEHRIRDPRSAWIASGILALLVTLFVLHSWLHLEVGLAAMIGAGITLVFLRGDIHESIMRVEWNTIVFLTGLFILVGGVQATGFLVLIGDQVLNLSGGSLALSMVLILWVSAIASAFVDNIPFAITMLPVVDTLKAGLEAAGVPAEQTIGLWWALILGADLGGNATLVGASANIVGAGMAERAGHPISFMEFVRAGAPVAFVTCLVGTIFLLLTYG